MQDCTMNQQQQQQQQRQLVRHKKHYAQLQRRAGSTEAVLARPHRPRLQQRLLLLLVAAAVLGWPSAHAWRDHVLDLGHGVYNPSLVLYQGTAWAVARSTQLKWDSSGLKWIINGAQLCSINTTDWSTLSCHGFDPWRGRYGVQCRWGSDEWKVRWEAWGVDDTKLFVWPGKGLWALTGRRPMRAGDSKYCPQVIWRQWLVQLADEGQQLDLAAYNYPSNDVIPGVTWAVGSQAGTTAAGDDSSSSSSSVAAAQHAAAEVPAARRFLHFFWNRPAAAATTAVATTADTTSVPTASVAEAAAGLGSGSKSHLASTATHPVSSRPLLRVDVAWLGPPSIGKGAEGSEQEGLRPRSGRRMRRRWRRARLRTRPEHRRPGHGAQQEPYGSSNTSATPAAGAGKPPGLLPANPSSSSSSSSGSTWSGLLGAAPVPLHITDAAGVYGTGYAISEKNWMPFVHQGQLLVSYTLAPKHRIYQVNPDGSAEPKYESDTEGDVFASLGDTAASRMHGGPPMIRIDPAALAAAGGAAAAGGGGAGGETGPGNAHYLGVAHYWESSGDAADKEGRVYKHFLIRVEAQPPFRVLQVSRELPLKFNTHYKKVAFVSGLDVAMLPAGSSNSISGSSSSGDGNPAATPAPAASTAAPTHTRRLTQQQQQQEGPQPRQQQQQQQKQQSGQHTQQQHRQRQRQPPLRPQDFMALMRGTAAAVGGRRLQAHAAPPPSAAGTTAAADKAVVAAADAVATDTGSTGSLAADADADEFTWRVQQQPVDVNAFSWAAKAGTLRLDPQAQGESHHTSQPSTAAASGRAQQQQQQQALQKGHAAAAARGAIEGGAHVQRHTPRGGQKFGANDDPQSSEFSWDAKPDPADVNVFSWSVKKEVGAAAAKNVAAAAGADLVPLPALPALPAAAGVLGGVPHVLISYGSGDWEARVAVLTLHEVQQLFD